jgi:hypothetical protein
MPTEIRRKDLRGEQFEVASIFVAAYVVQIGSLIGW